MRTITERMVLHELKPRPRRRPDLVASEMFEAAVMLEERGEPELAERMFARAVLLEEEGGKS